MVLESLGLIDQARQRLKARAVGEVEQDAHGRNRHEDSIRRIGVERDKDLFEGG